MHKLVTTYATKTIHAPRVCTHVCMHNVSTWLSGQNEDLQSVIPERQIASLSWGPTRDGLWQYSPR